MKSIHKRNYFVLAGTSGTGKTSVLEKLHLAGYPCANEAARSVLSEQLAIDGPALPSKDPMLFIKSMLDKNMSDFNELNASPQPCFFDRGMPDLVQYAIRFNVDSALFKEADQNYRYNEKVFLFTPWREIFVNDNERRMTFEKSIEFHDLIIKCYLESGYSLIEVPHLSVESRVQFILNRISDLQ